MTQLSEILDPDFLYSEVAGGWIREQTHPEWENLSIFNYTEMTQYTRRWNEATKMCRGLIVDRNSGEVLARPFPKIHNFDEAEAPRIVDNQILYHWDNKWDGSLGIAYRNPIGKIALATRGSFASEQAIRGTELLQEFGLVQECEDAIDAGYTPLFEIIYPANRVVIDYGDAEMLPELGFIQIDTGAFTPGRSAKAEKRTMYSFFMDLSRENAEGWVAWLNPWKAVKIKQADYVELHRVITGLSLKEVWRRLSAGTYDEFVMKLPDEFYRMVEDMRGDLESEFAAIKGAARGYYLSLLTAALPTRRQQADWVVRNVPKNITGLVFSQLDGKAIDAAIWKMVEPRGKFGEVVSVG